VWLRKRVGSSNRFITSHDIRARCNPQVRLRNPALELFTRRMSVAARARLNMTGKKQTLYHVLYSPNEQECGNFSWLFGERRNPRNLLAERGGFEPSRSV
jgi:hypothetical protein